MASVFDCTQYILSHLAAGRDVETVKVTKLLYLAQGYHYALVGEPLFPEDVHVGRHGPTVMELMDRDLGANLSEGMILGDVTQLSQAQKKLIAAVVREYGSKPMYELCGVTMQRPSPWDTTVNGDLLTDAYGRIIPRNSSSNISYGILTPAANDSKETPNHGTHTERHPRLYFSHPCRRGSYRGNQLP